MLDTTTSLETADSDPAETTTRNMVALGKKRSRGQRLFKLCIAIVALAIAAVIFGNIYYKTLEPGFEWKWLD